MEKITTLFVMLLVLGFAHAQVTQCYYCLSSEGEGCHDPFDKSQAVIQNCADGSTIPARSKFLSMIGGNSSAIEVANGNSSARDDGVEYVCITLNYVQNDEQVTIRGCEKEFIDSITACTYYRAVGKPATVSNFTCDSCPEQLCNDGLYQESSSSPLKLWLTVGVVSIVGSMLF